MDATPRRTAAGDAVRLRVAPQVSVHYQVDRAGDRAKSRTGGRHEAARDVPGRDHLRGRAAGRGRTGAASPRRRTPRGRTMAYATVILNPDRNRARRGRLRWTWAERIAGYGRWARPITGATSTSTRMRASVSTGMRSKTCTGRASLIDAPVTVPHLLLSCGDLPQEWADSLRKLVRVVVIRRVRARRGGDLHAQALAEPARDLGGEWEAVLAHEQVHWC